MRAAAIGQLLDDGGAPGTVKIYTGAQPATADDIETGDLLATVVLPRPVWDTVADGVATAFDPDPVAAVNSGLAGWFRAADSNGNAVHDGTCSATGGGGQLQLSDDTLNAGQLVNVTAYTWTEPGV